MNRVGRASSVNSIRIGGTFAGVEEKRVLNVSEYSHIRVSSCGQCESRKPFYFSRVNMAEMSARSVSSRASSSNDIISGPVNGSISYL